MKNIIFLLTLVTMMGCQLEKPVVRKAVFIILDGIPADVIEKVETPVLDEIAAKGGYTRAWLGGMKGGYSQSPTISAVGYNHLLTGVWTNKHNVHGNGIEAPNYHYKNIFRIAEEYNPSLHTAIFSTWLDNRTKLVGESLPEAGAVQLDYSFDGFELDTVKFPHTPDRTFIFEIDEHVSTEAGRYLLENGPDLSWVYLEFTDDMGHMYGDSPEFYDAVRKADAQVGRVWNAIKKREAETGEEWMIIITTDHGRDVATGKHHGGQSDRERTIWITTNVSSLNERFKQMPAIVDILPSVLRFMNIPIPEDVEQELDGIPFTGPVSVTDLQAIVQDESVELTWKAVDPQGEVEIFFTTTNHFREGKEDVYIPAGRAPVSEGSYVLNTAGYPSEFYKVLVRAPHNAVNVWAFN